MKELQKERIEVLNGIHTIDTNMNLMIRYNAAYIFDCDGATVMVDCGRASCWSKYTSERIREAGFDPKHIDYLFITHEHQDHMGAVGHVVQQNPDVKVFCQAKCAPFLMDVKIAEGEKKTYYETEKQRKTIGYMLPTPGKNIHLIDHNEIVDINGHKIKCYWTPGHRDGSASYHYLDEDVVFCGDLPGNCFIDAGSHYTLCGNDNNYMVGLKSLQFLSRLNAKYLAMGHYGISTQYDDIIENAIDLHQGMLDGAKAIMEENRGAEQTDKLAEFFMAQHMPALEALLENDDDASGRGKGVYVYATTEHLPVQSRRFAGYCQKIYFPELAPVKGN